MSQILGALIACALVYNQWKSLIDAAEAALVAKGPEIFASTQFTGSGPPGIFAFYIGPSQTLARIFLNEFVNVSGVQEVTTKRQVTHLLILNFNQSTIIGIVIWATMDPTNYLIPPTAGPVIISLA